MAFSGNFQVYSESVDYPGPPWGRGAASTVTTLYWNINDDNYLTIWYGDTTGSLSWYPCSSYPKAPSYQLAMDVQVSDNGYDGWGTIYHAGLNIPQCGTSEAFNFKVWQYMRDEINSFGGYQLERPLYVRVIYYATKPPYPGPGFRNAYPDANYASQSQVTHIPYSYIHVTEEMVIQDYRPGERKVNGTWRSHDHDSGWAERKNGSWYELRTEKGDKGGTGRPPERKRSGTWYNMQKIGAE